MSLRTRKTPLKNNTTMLKKKINKLSNLSLFTRKENSPKKSSQLKPDSKTSSPRKYSNDSSDGNQSPSQTRRTSFASLKSSLQKRRNSVPSIAPSAPSEQQEGSCFLTQKPFLDNFDTLELEDDEVFIIGNIHPHTSDTKFFSHTLHGFISHFAREEKFPQHGEDWDLPESIFEENMGDDVVYSIIPTHKGTFVILDCPGHSGDNPRSAYNAMCVANASDHIIFHTNIGMTSLEWTEIQTILTFAGDHNKKCSILLHHATVRGERRSKQDYVMELIENTPSFPTRFPPLLYGVETNALERGKRGEINVKVMRHPFIAIVEGASFSRFKLSELTSKFGEIMNHMTTVFSTLKIPSDSVSIPNEENLKRTLCNEYLKILAKKNQVMTMIESFKARMKDPGINPVLKCFIHLVVVVLLTVLQIVGFSGVQGFLFSPPKNTYLLGSDPLRVGSILHKKGLEAVTASFLNKGGMKESEFLHLKIADVLFRMVTGIMFFFVFF